MMEPSLTMKDDAGVDRLNTLPNDALLRILLHLEDAMTFYSYLVGPTCHTHVRGDN
jgi:hypothetical protein